MAQFAMCRLFEKGYRPQLTRVHRIGPEPFAWPENLIVLFEGAGATKSPEIVNAAGTSGNLRLPFGTLYNFVQSCTRSKMSKVHKVKS